MANVERVTPDTVRLRRLGARVAREVLSRRNDVLAIGVCGSVARGDAGPGSDLDVIVIVGRGSRKHTVAILNGTVVSLTLTPRTEFEREFTEPGPELAHQQGGLRIDALHDPGGLFPKVRAKVARLPERVYRDSARDALAEMYEYMGKFRNARRRGDHANLVYAAFVLGSQAINLVGNLNRRPYASENTMWTEWRTFPSLPPRFPDLIDIVCGFRRVSDRRLTTATEALWATCRRWAATQGIRVPIIRSVRSLPIPGRKTT